MENRQSSSHRFEHWRKRTDSSSDRRGQQQPLQEDLASRVHSRCSLAGTFVRGGGGRRGFVRPGRRTSNEKSPLLTISYSSCRGEMMGDDEMLARHDYEGFLNGLSESDREVGEKLRRHLQFFFMDPLQKWRLRRQLPYKLILQVFKIVMVTMQLILFAELRMAHVDFMEDTNTVMRHKFLKDWDLSRDTVIYPPAAGPFSVFNNAAIIDHFAHIVKAYYTVQEDMFGSFGYDTSRMTSSSDSRLWITPFDEIPPIRYCSEQIKNVEIRNNTYIFDVSDVTECRDLILTQEEVRNLSTGNTTLARDVLSRHNITFSQQDALKLSTMRLKFKLLTIHFSPLTADQRPECYKLTIAARFDNSEHTGQVKIDLQANIAYVDLCNGRLLQAPSVSADTLFMGIVDFFVLVMCLASLMLCCRALVKAHLLKLATVDYFAVVLRRPLALSDRLDFCNLWYVMIVINDVCIVIGTICKISIEFQDFDNSLFTTTGILLGVGSLLVYVGVLRYFGFFSQYNRSLPNILRFMVCTFVLYAGFLLAGWLIIGPYSLKFRSLSKSSEALFSLLNGDDMFATFFTINENNLTIKVFGTIYIYVFVSLFIYVVLSLFIAIIMDAYEIVKDRYDHGLTVFHSVLHEFINSAAPPLLNDQAARDQFAQRRLLDLGQRVLVLGRDCDCWALLERVRRLCTRRRSGFSYGSFQQQQQDGDQDDDGIGAGAEARTSREMEPTTPGRAAAPANQ